jgi:hypothetical protein
MSVHHRSVFHLRRESVDQAWEKTRAEPGPGDEMTAFVFRLLPKVGPLQVFQFHVPTDETEQLFADSLKGTITDYEVNIADARLDLADINLDTGRPTRSGEYRYCDLTFAQLLHRLEKARFAAMTPALRDDLLGFYRDSSRDTMRRKPRRWRRVMRDLNKLKGATAG